MDITQAKELLGTVNSNLQKQIDANNLAISILDTTFQAEFTSIETNRKITEEKVALVGDLTTRATTAELEQANTAQELDAANTQIATLTDALTTEQAARAEAEVTIVTLQTALAEKEAAPVEVTEP